MAAEHLESGADPGNEVAEPHQMFSFYTTQDAFKHSTIANQGNHLGIKMPSFSKSSVFKIFSVSPAFSSSSGLKSVFSPEKLHLVWTVCLTVEIKLGFEISPV